MLVFDKQFCFGNQVRNVFFASEKYGLKQGLVKSRQCAMLNVKKNFVIGGFVMSLNNTLNPSSACRNLFVGLITQKKKICNLNLLK